MAGTKTTPEILRALRTDKDMSQKEVGVALGISQQQYSQYETGQIDLPLRHLRKLLDLYDVSADYLLGRTQRPENKSFRNVQVTKDCSCTALLNAVLSLSEEDREAAVEYVRLLRLKERAKKT